MESKSDTKRPILSSSNSKSSKRRGAAPPPLTATAKRLAALLDGDKKRNKRRKHNGSRTTITTTSNQRANDKMPHDNSKGAAKKSLSSSTTAAAAIVPKCRQIITKSSSKQGALVDVLQQHRILSQARGWKPAGTQKPTSLALQTLSKPIPQKLGNPTTMPKSTRLPPQIPTTSSKTIISNPYTTTIKQRQHQPAPKRVSLEGHDDVKVGKPSRMESSSTTPFSPTNNPPKPSTAPGRQGSNTTTFTTKDNHKNDPTTNTTTTTTRQSIVSIHHHDKPVLSLVSSKVARHVRPRLATRFASSSSCTNKDTLVVPLPKRTMSEKEPVPKPDETAHKQSDDETMETIPTQTTLPSHISTIPTAPQAKLSAIPNAPSMATTMTTTRSQQPFMAKTTTTYRPNLVRQNLRNANGSCRNKRTSTKKRAPPPPKKVNTATMIERPQGLCSQTGMDPLDDFVDGVDTRKAKLASKGIPLCQGHQQPCKLRTVRKTTSAHRGRKFYVCAMERRHEQCNHFQWADDNDVGSHGVAVTQEDSTTAFVQRAVHAFLQNLQPLTVPELRSWATARNLSTRGKRGLLWTRIALYVRDEIASALTGESSSASSVKVEVSDGVQSSEQDHDPNQDSIDSESELEFEGQAPPSIESFSRNANKQLVLARENTETKSEIGNKDFCKRDSTLLEASDDSDDEIEGDYNVVDKRRKLNSESSSILKDEEETDDSDDDDELEIAPPRIPTKKQVAQKHSCPLRERLQSLFGHSDFRPGQEWTIRRCLEGKRTLLVAPTGLGKSLCYALPAAMQPNGVVLVVSPLLSLIQDQLRELPPSLPAASLSGTTPSQALLQDLSRGRLRILFVSPERLVSPSFRRLLSKTSWNPTTQTYERIMPPVSLFCVDEAHCLSQWGHNFRPCYLRLRSMLNLIQPKSVLAITATAGPLVIGDITRTLDMPMFDGGSIDDEAKGIKIYNADRDNINVTARFVADHGERLNRLVKILSRREKEEKDAQAGCLSSGSVIVYVWRQMDAVAVAEYIGASNVPGKVVVYHGGMDSGSRAKSQSQFLRGKARICVATVAFGLGINKSDVAGVIHMYLSNTPEHYLQEIGRAGRNGGTARAISLVVPEEVQVRHSLSHSDLLAKTQVSALFEMLRSEAQASLCRIPEERRSCVEGLCVGLSLQSALVGCECKPETVETIFSLLEAREKSLLRVQGTFYGRAVIAPKKQTLEELSRKEKVVDAILRCCQCVEPPAGQTIKDQDKIVGFRGHNLVGQTHGSYRFSIAQCANCLGADAEPRHVFAALRRLQQSGQIEYVLDSTPAGRFIHMRLNRSIVDALCQGIANGYDDLVEETYKGFNLAVSTSANKVIEIYHILQRVSQVNEEAMHSEHKSASLHLFQELVQEYLAKDGGTTTGEKLSDDAVPDVFATKPTRKALDLAVWSVVQYLRQLQSSRAASDIEPMSLDHQTAADFMALAVTKFLHGIAPASSPQSLCRQHVSFGSFQAVEFQALREVVASVIG